MNLVFQNLMIKWFLERFEMLYSVQGIFLNFFKSNNIQNVKIISAKANVN